MGHTICPVRHAPENGGNLNDKIRLKLPHSVANQIARLLQMRFRRVNLSPVVNQIYEETRV